MLYKLEVHIPLGRWETRFTSSRKMQVRRKQPRLAALEPCRMTGPKVSMTTAQTDRATKPKTKRTMTYQSKDVINSVEFSAAM